MKTEGLQYTGLERINIYIHWQDSESKSTRCTLFKQWCNYDEVGRANVVAAKFGECYYYAESSVISINGN